jgi:hypothetical protein
MSKLIRVGKVQRETKNTRRGFIADGTTIVCPVNTPKAGSVVTLVVFNAAGTDPCT